MEAIAPRTGSTAASVLGLTGWQPAEAAPSARGGLRCLPLRVPHHRYEPGYSLLSRLAVRHGCSTVGEFITQLGQVWNGAQAQVLASRRLETLAALSGTSARALLAFQPGRGWSKIVSGVRSDHRAYP